MIWCWWWISLSLSFALGWYLHARCCRYDWTVCPICATPYEVVHNAWLAACAWQRERDAKIAEGESTLLHSAYRDQIATAIRSRRERESW